MSSIQSCLWPLGGRSVALVVCREYYLLPPMPPSSLYLFFLCLHRKKKRKGLFPNVTVLAKWLCCSFLTKSAVPLHEHPTLGLFLDWRHYVPRGPYILRGTEVVTGLLRRNPSLPFPRLSQVLKDNAVDSQWVLSNARVSLPHTVVVSKSPAVPNLVHPSNF